LPAERGFKVGKESIFKIEIAQKLTKNAQSGEWRKKIQSKGRPREKGRFRTGGHGIYRKAGYKCGLSRGWGVEVCMMPESPGTVNGHGNGGKTGTVYKGNLTLRGFHFIGAP